MRVLKDGRRSRKHTGAQQNYAVPAVPPRRGIVYVLAPRWRKRQSVCCCGWRGRRRLLEGWAVTDAHLHGAQFGCEPAAPLVWPADLEYSRPGLPADPMSPLTFTNEPSPIDVLTAVRSLTERNCVAMNPNPQTNHRPNASTAADNLWAVWRRLCLVLRGDPVAAVTSPAAAVHLADETLALIAVGRAAPPFGAHVWTGLAVEPLAALLCAASPIGAGHGIEWVRDTAARLDCAEPDDPIWDCARDSTPAGARYLGVALVNLRELEPHQRRSVTHVMAGAAERLHR